MDLEDMAGPKIDRAEVHRNRLNPRHVQDLDRAHVAAMTTHREPEHEPLLLVHNLDATKIDAGDVAERAGIHRGGARQGSNP